MNKFVTILRRIRRLKAFFRNAVRVMNPSICVSELFLHFADGSCIPLRCVDGDDSPTLGKAFTDGMDTLSWAFGRHPEWCDVVWDRPLSTIHFTIFYDRSLGDWFIQDGGFYPRPLKMIVPKGYSTPSHHKTDPRSVGFNPSTQGTYLNRKRLLYTQPEDGSAPSPRRMPLYPGDLIFAAGKKIYVSGSAIGPSDFDWHGIWIKEEPTGEIVSATQAQELLEQQQSKEAPNNVTSILGFLERRLAKASLIEKLAIYGLITLIAIVALIVILGGR
ncbi:MAG: FHA domain-containing protein [Cyanobacteria bacterium P01_F01_bin.3]